jgi:CheY-like chemotaxis protein
MKIIRNGAEHHLLNVYKITKLHQRSTSFIEDFAKRSESLQSNGFIYHFADGSVLALVRPASNPEYAQLQAIFSAMAAQIPAGLSEMNALANTLYNHQKLADRKLLSSRRFAAYKSMTDTAKISTLAERRMKKTEPHILLIEDDRFTAAYTTTILNQDYDLNVCRTGEEGIISYISLAPCVVFMDIHLPGLNGHETLAAIKAIDPSAYVVMLSVDTARNAIVQATNGGAGLFLKKPFSKDRLLNVVRNSPFIRHFAPPGAQLETPAAPAFDDVLIGDNVKTDMGVYS